MKLNNKNLSEITELLPAPSSDRGLLKTGIVHIGIGGFHRSHQAFYVNQLIEKNGANNWGICGVGLREADRQIYNTLKKQDCLYTLTVQHPNGTIESEVVGSINDFLLAVDEPNSVIERMAHSETKIVSLTITEGGYNFNPATGLFDFENPVIKHELNNPNDPKTIYGYLSLALKKRKEKGTSAFTVMSCDNIQHNGDVIRKMLLAFIEKQDPELAKWVEAEVCFPNSMVDRITPVSTQSDIDYIKNTYGFEDQSPVICEPYIQWVIEDKFSNGRPEFEKVGVQFVADVTPYEKMKIRLLNAGHSVLGIPGAIYGHPTINACMADEVFSKFMRHFMDKEVSPVLDPVEGIDLEKYKDSLEERFANPNIKDSVGRICSESSAKLPKFLVPTIQENLAKGGSFEYGALLLAAWCFYSDKKVNQQGEAIEVIDQMSSELHQAAKNTEKDVLSFLRQEDLFGDLVENKEFTEKYAELVDALYNGRDIRGMMSETCLK